VVTMYVLGGLAIAIHGLRFPECIFPGDEISYMLLFRLHNRSINYQNVYLYLFIKKIFNSSINSKLFFLEVQ
jgi:hypothetical protein